MTDTDRAKAFLENKPVPIDSTSSIEVAGDSFNRVFTEGHEPRHRAPLEAISILHCWLLEQLRCGGKNGVMSSDLYDGTVMIVVTDKTTDCTLCGCEGESDLDALIKAYEQFKELDK